MSYFNFQALHDELLHLSHKNTVLFFIRVALVFFRALQTSRALNISTYARWRMN